MLEIAWKTLILYAFLITTVRLLGKRQIGEMEPSEFVVSMLLANLATLPIEEDIPLLHGILPIVLVFCGEWILSLLSLKNIKIRRLFCGKPVLLIENGKISQRNLRRTRISLDELTMNLRENGIFDLSTVKYAILETNGQISTLLYSEHAPASAKDAGIPVTDTELPITIISDGRLLHENLRLAGRDHRWVEKLLMQKGCKKNEVLMLTVDKAGTVTLLRRQEENPVEKGLTPG